MAASNTTRRLLSDLNADEKKYLLEKQLYQICEHLDEQDLIDVTFKLQNPVATITAHRLILSAASPCFKQIFKSENGKGPVIEIRNIDSVTFERVINFCYTGKMIVTLENVDKTLRAAKILQLDFALSNCIEFVMENITEYTLKRACELAKETKCDALRQKLIVYEIRNFMAIIDSPEFENCDFGTFMEVLESDEMNLQDEDKGTLLAIKRLYEKHISPNKDALSDSKGYQLSTPLNTDFFLKNKGLRHCCECADTLSWIDYPTNRASLSLRFAKLQLSSENEYKPSLVETSLLALNISGDNHTGLLLQYNKTEDSWKEWAKINTGLHFFQAVFMDNELYFIGGSRNGYEAIGDVRSWNFKNKTFKKLASLNEPRYFHNVALLNNEIYAIGGRGADDEISNLVERYCRVSNEWTIVKSMSIKRYNAGVVAHNGKIYVMGGFSEEIQYKSVECYDPATNCWTKCAPMNKPHGWPGGIEKAEYIAQTQALRECKVSIQKVERSVCRMTGEISDKTMDEIASFLPITSKVNVALLEEKLRDPEFAQAMTTHLYKIKGKSEDVSYVVRQIFSDEIMESFNWEGRWDRDALAKLTIFDKIFEVEVHNGHIFVVGGDEGNHLKTVERYDPERNVWTLVHALRVGRVGIACISVENQLWAIGGSNNGKNNCVAVYDDKKDEWNDKHRITKGRYYCFNVPKTLLE